MSDSEKNPFSVTVSLCAGPPGKLRLEFGFPYRKLLEGLLRRFRPGTPHFSSMHYTPPILEVDRANLHRLNFSQQELAEIGFGLVKQLAIVDRCRGSDEGGWYFVRKPPFAA